MFGIMKKGVGKGKSKCSNRYAHLSTQLVAVEYRWLRIMGVPNCIKQ